MPRFDTMSAARQMLFAAQADDFYSRRPIRALDKAMSLKTLLIMRHAKSSWSFEDASDHERPLNARGLRDAPLIGGVLRARKIFPDLIWSSDSTRTRETASGLLTRGPEDLKTECIYLSRFYHASANSVLTQCAARGEPGANALMLLGHNPGWEDLVYYFADRPHRMPTGACAVLSRKDEAADWLSPQAWHLQDLIKPKDLQG